MNKKLVRALPQVHLKTDPMKIALRLRLLGDFLA